MKNLIKCLIFAAIIALFAIAHSQANNPSPKTTTTKFPVVLTPSCNNQPYCNQYQNRPYSQQRPYYNQYQNRPYSQQRPYYNQYQNRPYSQQRPYYNQSYPSHAGSSRNNSFYYSAGRNNRYASNQCANCGINLPMQQTSRQINPYDAQFIEPSQYYRMKKEERYYQNQPNYQYNLCDRCRNSRNAMRPPVILPPYTPSLPQPVPAPNRTNLSQPIPAQPQGQR